MSQRFFSAALLLLYLVLPTTKAQARPLDVSYCDLATNPASYDGKMIRVRGTLNVFFEDFSLFDKSCKSDQEIWMAFGGDVPGIVASTVNDNQRTPGSDIKVNGTPYAIQKDESFRRLYALITTKKGNKPVYSVTATLTGSFFAGEPRKGSDGVTRYTGYGHLGCCSLLVITQVSDVDSVPPASLNLVGVVLGPSGKPAQGIVVFNDSDGGTPPERQEFVTGENGQFHFSDAGQVIRIEMPEYRPFARIVSADGPRAKVKLEAAKTSDWVVPTCSGAVTKSRIGFKALVSLPRPMTAEYQKYDGNETYFVFPKSSSAPEAEFIISHESADIGENGAGRDSKSFSQRWVKNSSGEVLGVDSRGETRTGIYYRAVTFGRRDTLGYGLDRKGESPDKLDKIIDGLCITSN
ncbi:MAG TPA: hypothetical protein VMB47_20200 [Candidatus Aquilonibacter sp.]|nr:hypothetical protein [Candidatus Aquilonibacter sp.]